MELLAWPKESQFLSRFHVISSSLPVSSSLKKENYPEIKHNDQIVGMLKLHSWLHISDSGGSLSLRKTWILPVAEAEDNFC